MFNDLYNELSTNFIEYAAAVNTDRAIPDSKSGLKPVARRILFGAYKNGYASSKEYKKCAKLVGDVMGQLHPHGDSSIYGALVRLSQPWIMRYPLLDFYGNMGNIGGDGPAAARYTNIRLNKLSEQGMLNGLKKRNVDFIPDYDEVDEEPTTLPAIFPNLLCNPNTGIGVAMACNWLPHNLNEVGEAIFSYLRGEEPTLPGPDFPTGGIVINAKDIPLIMKTGHGSVKVRARHTLEKDKIVFTEIPYGTTTEGLMAEIGKLCDDGEFEEITDVRDESNKKGLRIVVECKRNSNLTGVVKRLFAKTNLQNSISYNQVALIDKTPTELNLKDCIEIYVNHNIDCIKREWEFDLEKAKDRLHIIEGLLIALEDIDNVINLIKKSESSAAAKDNLIEKYKLTEVQAKAILDMKLARLAKLEKIELENEKNDLYDFINDLVYALATPERQKEEVKVRLQNIIKKFGDKRKTELVNIEVPKEDKEIAEVVPEDVVVVVSQNDEIKRVPKKNFKVQRRNGKGVKSESDAIATTISTNTIDNLLFFTDKGKMYRLVVDNVPVGTNGSKGIPIKNLVKLEPDEKVIATTSIDRKCDEKYIVFITKKGMIKKSLLEEYFKTKRTTGIIAIKLKEEDSIANVEFMNEEDIILITKNGMSIHFETKSIAAIGRASAGVKSIKLDDDDEVLAGIALKENITGIATFSENGLGRQSNLKEFPKQGRGGKGVKLNGDVVSAIGINKDDNLLICGIPSSLCISATDVPVLGRVAAGNIMIKNSKIKKVIKL